MKKRKNLIYFLIGLYLVTTGLIVNLFSSIDTNLSDKISRYVYTYLLFDQDLTKSTSNIGIIEVTNEDVEEYGWPIPYNKYSILLSRLKDSSQPFILQTLNFSQLEDESNIISAPIKNYEKISGSNFTLVSKEDLGHIELSEDVEFELIPKVIFSNAMKSLGELPLLALSFNGIYNISENYQGNGFNTNLSSSVPNNCIQLYIPSKSHDIVIPSNIFSFLNMYNENGIKTTKNAVKKRAFSNASVSKNIKGYTDYICSANPNTDTTKYNVARNILKYSFGDLITGEASLGKEKALILTTSWGKKYTDPGKNIFNETRKSFSGELIARFLDELVNNRELSFKSFRLDGEINFSYLIILLFSIFFARGHFKVANTLSLFTLTTLTIYSSYELNLNQTVLIPSFVNVILITSALTSILIQTTLLIFDHLLFSSKKEKIESLIQFTPSPKTLFETIEENIEDFDFITISYSDPLNEMYSLLSKGNQAHALNVATNTKLSQNPKGDAPTTNEVIDSNTNNVIGEFEIAFNKKSAEQNNAFTQFVNFLNVTTRRRWLSIYQESSTKLEAFKKERAENFSGILTQFLPDSLIKKLDSEEFSENSLEMTLNSLLTPRQTSIALLQADIRGFSKLSKIYSDLEMVTYIQSYYEKVVEKAQAHAQLKLIGDCIFLFIEQNYDNEKSASDLAFDIAKDLSKSTSELNIKNKDKEDVNFGIAIHFGAAVIGNLSSSSCIDYTVLGNEVNKVARIEELTKNEFIQNYVGHNGVLLSKEALNNLRFYNNIKFEKITLQDHGLAIRSFESTEEVYYLNQSKLVNSAS